jgi:hypothetical protein
MNDEYVIETKRKPRKLAKKKLGKAPREIVPMPNPDKQRHESYKNGQNPIRFPKPFRCVILGKVNSGKSLLAKHIIMAHQAVKPKFQEIHVIHGCNSTHEYDDIEPTSMREDIPHYSEYDPDALKLLIFDDMDFSMIRGEQLKNLSEIMRFGSTHCNISVLVLHQQFFSVPKVVKDCSNVFVIFRPHNTDELSTIGRRVGLKKEEIFNIFRKHLPNWRDSLLINLVPDAPYKFGKNLFEPLKINDALGESSESESD